MSRSASTPAVMIWDFLALLLIVFPLVTGGVWIERPHLFLELSDLGIPVLIVALLAAVVKLGFRQPLEESRLLQLTRELWHGWSSWLERSPLQALLAGWFWVSMLWAWSSLAKHAAFDSHAFDLGIFTNAIWNLTHGNGYFSAVKGGISLFADHQSPLFWALAPIFALFPHPQTLLIAQALGLALGAVPLYFLGRQYLKGEARWLAAVPILYWGYLPLRNANAFDFHPEVLMLPLFLAAIAGLQSVGGSWRARGGGALALLLALGAKESAGPVASGIGLAWVLGASPEASRRFTRRIGWVVAGLGLAIFLFDLEVVTARYAAGGGYAYAGLYSQYGTTLAERLLFPFRKPGAMLAQLFDRDRRKFLFWTLAPLGFLPLAGWPALAAALPGYLMLFLSAGSYRVNLTYHYAVEPAVGLFWALPVGIRAMRGRGAWVAAGVVFFALGTFGRSELFRIRRSAPSEHARWLSSELLPAVASGVSVAASDSLVPHLSTRRWVHALDSLDTPEGPVDCVIRDLDVGNWPMGQAEMDALAGKLAIYREVYRCGALTVFAREGVVCMTRAPECTRR